LRIIKVRQFNDLVNIKKYKGEDILIDISNVSIALRKSVLSFLAGVVFFKGGLKKVSKDKFLMEGLWEESKSLNE